MSGKILVGVIVGAYGVKGWVKVKSYTDPVCNILDYSPWLIGEESTNQKVKVLDGREQGSLVVARLEGVEDRDQAAALRHTRIWVERSAFAHLDDGEYYWTDLVGLKVVNLQGVALGEIAGLMETGANDVVIVQGNRERLIPFVRGQYVKNVSLESGEMLVDWDPEF